jgi:hypothetical protein
LKNAADAKAKVDRLAKEEAERKHRELIHARSFEHSLESENIHKEWLNGETNNIFKNGTAREKRNEAVEEMFRMRRKANDMTHLVNTVHTERLNKAIESSKQAAKVVEQKLKELTAAKKAHKDAKDASKAALDKVKEGEKEKVRIVKKHDGMISQKNAEKLHAEQKLSAAK